jgi:hypothetical protein
MTQQINRLVALTEADGTPTIRGVEYFRNLERRIAAAEAKLAAIAAITAPTGGATIDSQARTAINAILAGAS